MSRFSTARGTKRETLARLSALRAQFGEHGVKVEEHVQERRGLWRLKFKLTPERERIRLQNVALKEQGRPVFEPTESQRAILASIFGGAELVRWWWRGKYIWKVSSTRVADVDIALLLSHKLIRQVGGDECVLTQAGTREVLRRLGGNP